MKRRIMNYNKLFKNGITDEALSLWGEYALQQSMIKVEQYLWRIKWFDWYYNHGLCIVNSKKNRPIESYGIQILDMADLPESSGNDYFKKMWDESTE